MINSGTALTNFTFISSSLRVIDKDSFHVHKTVENSCMAHQRRVTIKNAAIYKPRLEEETLLNRNNKIQVIGSRKPALSSQAEEINLIEHDPL